MPDPLKEELDRIVEFLRSTEQRLNGITIKLHVDHGGLSFRRLGQRWRLCFNVGEDSWVPVTDIKAIQKIEAAEQVNAFLEAYHNYQAALTMRARRVRGE